MGGKPRQKGAETRLHPARFDPIGVKLMVRSAGTLSRFRQTARSLGFDNRTTGSGDDNVETWMTEDRECAASWIDEPGLDARFVWIRGRDWESAARRFERELPATTSADIAFRLLTEDHDQDTWVYSLYWIGYMARGLPIDIEVFDRAISDPRPVVRIAALNGWMIQRWEAWRNRVVRAAAEDPDSRVRAKASQILVRQ